MKAGPTTMTAFLGQVTLDVPARCEVHGISRPSSDSQIGFEVWLPLNGWNGKYQQKGNGGFAGSVNRASLMDPLRRGYAVAATDGGHDAAKTPQGTFAIGHPEKVVDFGYRAVHDTAEQANAIAAAFYGKPPTRNYFVGCSDGGREALMEAQRFPEDFDGILGGAPANDWSHLFTSFVWNELALSQERIPVEKLPAIQRAVVAACDEADGLKDGLVSNPPACRFDPAVLACEGADNKDCLTSRQLDTLKALYSGPRNPSTSKPIFGGLVTSGTEAMPLTWPLWVLGAAPGQSVHAGYGISYFRDVVFERPDWQVQSMDFDRDVRVSDEKVAPIFNATNPDLRSFRARGGRLVGRHCDSGSHIDRVLRSRSIVHGQCARSEKHDEGHRRLLPSLHGPGIGTLQWGRGAGAFWERRRLRPGTGGQHGSGARHGHGAGTLGRARDRAGPPDWLRSVSARFDEDDDTAAVSAPATGQVQGNRGYKRCGELRVRDSGAMSWQRQTARTAGRDRGASPIRQVIAHAGTELHSARSRRDR